MRIDQHIEQSGKLTWFKSSYSGTNEGPPVSTSHGLRCPSPRDRPGLGMATTDALVPVGRPDPSVTVGDQSVGAPRSDELVEDHGRRMRSIATEANRRINKSAVKRLFMTTNGYYGHGSPFPAWDSACPPTSTFPAHHDGT